MISMSKPYVHTELIHNTNAAKEVIPLIMERFQPRSVVDIGCGTGTWLAVFQENNVDEFIGVDGDYVDRKLLHIPEDRFVCADLSQPFTYPRRFDLAVSLEVAEHIPEASAEAFVESLVNLSDVILFSAAVPGQGGQHHINEQWYDYWQRKFRRHGYQFHDDLRPLIWWNRNVEWWYRQNVFLVVKESHPYSRTVDSDILSTLHPDMHKYYKDIYETQLQRLLPYEKNYKVLVSGQAGLKKSLGVFLRALHKSIFK